MCIQFRIACALSCLPCTFQRSNSWAFVESNRSRNKSRRVSSLKGRGAVIEYFSGGTPFIGDRPSSKQSRTWKVCQEPTHGSPSITCTHFSPIQRFKVAQHGTRDAKKFRQNQPQTRRTLAYGMAFLLRLLRLLQITTVGLLLACPKKPGYGSYPTG